MKVDRRSLNHAPRTPARVGEIRMRMRRGEVPRKMIKVGESPARWVEYARYLYEEAHGPVGPDKRVVHLDGDSSNCALSNLRAVTAADAIFLWHQRNPEGSRLNYAKCRAATARSNRKRSRAMRLNGVCMSMWYPVEHPWRQERGKIHLAPRRKRWQVWTALGIDVDTAQNGRGADSAALGWPGLNITEALILTALADGYGPEAVQHRVQWMRRERDLPAIRMAWGNKLSSLRAAGLIDGGRWDYRLTEKARAARRGGWTRAVPVRGYELGRECKGYQRVRNERGLEVVR